MKPKSEARSHQSTRFRVGGWLCVVLGVMWAFSPVLHGLFHITDVAHHHPEGSVHGHYSTSHHGHDHTDGSHSHTSRPQQESGKDSGERPDGEPQDDHKSPQPPAEDFPTFLFSALELAASDDISIEVELSETSHLGDEVFESVRFDVSTFVGAAGPRGPPA
ncbi:MAG: hypothetical protein VXZ82_16450 [Planctomycetota bacterium]|nr:hypothetical protein [Planctomycetota bacterium]